MWDTFSANARPHRRRHDRRRGLRPRAPDACRRRADGRPRLQAYRFSVSWPRVLPAGAGEVSPEGLGFYDRLVDELLARRHRALPDPVPLGPAAGARGSRRLAQPRLRRLVRRLRRGDDAHARRPGLGMVHAQRAVVLLVPRPPVRCARARHHRPGRCRRRVAPPVARPRSGDRGDAGRRPRRPARHRAQPGAGGRRRRGGRARRPAAPGRRHPQPMVARRAARRGVPDGRAGRPRRVDRLHPRRRRGGDRHTDRLARGQLLQRRDRPRGPTRRGDPAQPVSRRARVRAGRSATGRDGHRLADHSRRVDDVPALRCAIDTRRSRRCTSPRTAPPTTTR